MAVAIRQLQKHFVGEVSGVDLRVPLTKQRGRRRSKPAWTSTPCWYSTTRTSPTSNS